MSGATPKRVRASVQYSRAWARGGAGSTGQAGARGGDGHGAGAAGLAGEPGGKLAEAGRRAFLLGEAGEAGTDIRPVGSDVLQEQKGQQAVGLGQVGVERSLEAVHSHDLVRVAGPAVGEGTFVLPDVLGGMRDVLRPLAPGGDEAGRDGKQAERQFSCEGAHVGPLRPGAARHELPSSRSLPFAWPLTIGRGTPQD